VRGRHGALIILAVGEAESVTQFVHRLLQCPVAQQGGVGRQAVKLLPQPMGGDDGADAVQLRFAKDESQNRNIEVKGSHGENSPGAISGERTHTGEKIRGMELPPAGVKCRRGIERCPEHFARGAEPGTQLKRQMVQDVAGYVTDLENSNSVHKSSVVRCLLSVAPAPREMPYGN